MSLNEQDSILPPSGSRTSHQSLSDDDFDLLTFLSGLGTEEQEQEELRKAARGNFYAFRQYISIRPKGGVSLKSGWFVKDLCEHLQQFYTDFIAGKKPKLVIEAPPQHGKQCAVDTPVLTTKGWKNHGDLAEGDYVYHPSGKAIRVLKHIQQEQPCTLRVTFSNGESVDVHENHEWTVYNRGKKRFETIETKQMLVCGSRSESKNPLQSSEIGKRGSRYRFYLPHVSPLQSPDAELPVHPYVLGVWLGDGTQTKPYITFDDKDRILAKEIEWLVERLRDLNRS